MSAAYAHFIIRIGCGVSHTKACYLCQVERLHLIWCDHQRPGAPQRSVLQWCQQLQPQLAPTLTTLILENLQHTEMTSSSSLLVRAQLLSIECLVLCRAAALLSLC